MFLYVVVCIPQFARFLLGGKVDFVAPKTSVALDGASNIALGMIPPASDQGPLETPVTSSSLKQSNGF